MIKHSLFLGIILLFYCIKSSAQDHCAQAVSLCAGSSINRGTISATVDGTDPALSCGDAVVTNNIWFKVAAIDTGGCTITVSNINNNPGLDMEVYTGVCNSLVTTGHCASGSSLTGGTMSVTFPTTAGVIYYVMVDGNTGNQETFDIIATTPFNAIVARPDADFDVNPLSGCLPLTSLFHPGATSLHGGTSITYDWKFNAGGYIPSSGSDTTIIFGTIGTTTVTLRVCNLECGCKTVSQDIIVQNLFPSISFLPPTTCIGTPVSFSGSALVLPDPPNVDPNVTSWDWNFGDPASGVLNTASGQFVNHTFVGSGPSFNVSLIIQGTCGPDTAVTTLNLLVKPTVNISGPAQVCEGEDVNLRSSIANAASPITYNWSGPGSYSCTNCDSTSVSTLVAGGPYTIDLSIVDANGCISDSSFDVLINELPTVDAGGVITVCHNDSAQLNAVPSGGLPPYTFQWAPSAGLNNDTIVNPVSYITNADFAVTVIDSNGCISDPDTVTISEYPQPIISPSSADLCATQTPLQNTFTVSGPNIGSVYQWGLSTAYSRITGAAVDSSDITANFPPVVGTYNFTAVVTDGVTGCKDTVPTSFNVTAGLSMGVSGNNPICLGDTDTLIVSGATTYVWSASPAIAFADPTSATQIVSPAVNTTFTITGTQGTCTQTIVYNLIVGVKPVVAVDSIPAFCGCTTVLLNGVGSTPGMNYLWTSQSGGLISSPSNIVSNATLCGNDQITLKVTDPASGCFRDSTVSTVLRPNPNANVTVNPVIICNGVSTVITLDGTGSDLGLEYLWTTNNPAAIIANDTLLNTTATVSTATVFYLTVSDVNGCDSTYSDTLNIYPQPTLSIDFPFLCTSDTVLKSTLTISGASPGSTYTWDTIPACAVPSTASSSSQLFDLAACSAGVYHFSISVNDPVTTCTTVLSDSVTILTGVTLTVSSDTSFCEGGIATLTVSGANTFLWNTGDVNDTIIANGLLASGSPYLFTVFGTVGSCSNNATINVIVHAVPATSVICCDSSVCDNDIVNYFVGPDLGNPYNWIVNGGVIAIGQGTESVFVNWNTVGLGSITVLETTPFGCDGPLQGMNVIVNPLPSLPIVTGSDTVCNDEVATYFVNANAGSIYHWTVYGGNLTAGDTGTVNNFQWTTPGSDSLSVYEETSAGCFGDSTYFYVEVKPRPGNVTVTGNTLVCDNITEIYSIVPNVGSTYTWNVLNDLHDTLNPTSDTLTVDWGSSGNGHVTIFETNTFNCNSDTTDILVTKNAHPLISISNTLDTICSNTPYPLLASANTLNVTWYTDGLGSFDDPTLAAATYIPTPGDTGTVHLTMVASNPPCLNDSVFVVIEILPSPTVTITGPTSPICFGTLVSLTATGGGTYVWNPGGIPFAIIGVRPLVNSTYTVAVTNSYNCTTYDTFTVYVIPPGIADAGTDQAVCTGDSILLNGSQQNAGGVLWSTLGDGIFLPDSTTISVMYMPGPIDTTTNFVDIILTTTGACLNQSDTININIQKHPYIDVGNDTILSTKSSTGITLPLNPEVINLTGIIWTTTGSGTFDPSDTSVNAIYTPSDDDFKLDSVVIIGTTTGSCTPFSDSLTIDFAPFEIPNVFTPYPASPGQNDYFVIRFLTENCKLKVWDRWGSLVYTSDYYQNDWDANGLRADVYYYLVISEDKEYKGWVQVLRDE